MNLKNTLCRLLHGIIVFGCASLAANAQEPTDTIIQPFAGGTYVAQYSVDFDEISVLTGSVDSFTERTLEGHRTGSVQIKPEGKGNFEILKSFEKALKDAGFTILFSGKVDKGQMKLAITKLHGKNGSRDRSYVNFDGQFLSAGDLDYLALFPQYYLSASITKDGRETVFVLNLTSQRDRYLMEEVTTAAMEQDTVAINEEMLTRQIEDAGKAILYGIEFDTDSAKIRPSSGESLRVIANVLRSGTDKYYIVGHTDDTGSFDHNQTLSAERAASVIATLQEKYGVDAARLAAGGVGPMSPVASNENDAGKTLNRRVELVRRLSK